VVSVGLSLNSTIKIGTQLGYLEARRPVSDVGELKTLPAHEVTLLTSAAGRAAFRAHSHRGGDHRPGGV